MSKVRIVKPSSRQPASQPHTRAELPEGIDYVLFLTQTDDDGFPSGLWLALMLPSMKLVTLSIAGYQPIWRLIKALPDGKEAKPYDLQYVLSVPHKVMSADKQSRK